jgi:hypothetical protein
LIFLKSHAKKSMNDPTTKRHILALPETFTAFFAVKKHHFYATSMSLRFHVPDHV